MKLLLILSTSMLLLSGCQLTRVEGTIDDVEVKATTNGDDEHKGKFCPPGQAKKGNC